MFHSNYPKTVPCIHERTGSVNSVYLTEHSLRVHLDIFSRDYSLRTMEECCERYRWVLIRVPNKVLKRVLISVPKASTEKTETGEWT